MANGKYIEVRKRADKSEGTRLVRFDPITGEKKLVNPDTPGDDHESWPLSHIEGMDFPEECTVPTKFVYRGKEEGWLVTEGDTIVHRPSRAKIEIKDGSAAPPITDFLPPHSIENPPPHMFLHIDAFEIETSNYGKVRYTVVGQPDKYADNSLWDYKAKAEAKANDHDDETKVDAAIYGAGETRVDHFYRVVLESVERTPEPASTDEEN